MRGMAWDALDRCTMRGDDTFSSGFRGLAGAVRRLIVRSEMDGGLQLGGLRDGSRVVVQTQNRSYELEVREGQVWICGHPVFCPRPVQVRVHGSSWGGSMLKVAYIGRGMHLEFEHPQYATVTTSKIVAIRTRS